MFLFVAASGDDKSASRFGGCRSSSSSSRSSRSSSGSSSRSRGATCCSTSLAQVLSVRRVDGRLDGRNVHASCGRGSGCRGPGGARPGGKLQLGVRHTHAFRCTQIQRVRLVGVCEMAQTGAGRKACSTPQPPKRRREQHTARRRTKPSQVAARHKRHNGAVQPNFFVVVTVRKIFQR